ncbi:hypothetical protein [Ferrimicrobium sp.]|jgi:hypothetical protein|nr:hypothetical protein [Ferrimicrobium sp.]
MQEDRAQRFDEFVTNNRRIRASINAIRLVPLISAIVEYELASLSVSF